jgi:hypothetical protein
MAKGYVAELISIAAMGAGGALLLIGLASVVEDAASPICPAQTNIDLGVLLRGVAVFVIGFWIYQQCKKADEDSNTCTANDAAKEKRPRPIEGVVIPRRRNESTTRHDIPEKQKGVSMAPNPKVPDFPSSSEMLAPKHWDELAITRDFEKFRNDSNPFKGALNYYVQQLITRFVEGQDGKTALSRAQFLERQNHLLKIGMENIQLKREVLRANKKEDNNDLKLSIDAEVLKAEASLQTLRHDLERESILTEIERKKHERSNIGKEPPPPPPAPKQPSATEQREQGRRRLRSRINEIREEIRITEANPNTGEEQKQRFINILEDRIAGLEEEYAKLL